MTEKIYGSLQYCYGGVPVLRGYCSYKLLIKHSKPHPAYQRKSQDKHVEDIKNYISSPDFRFMPEVILSFNYSGMFETKMFKNILEKNILITPLEYLLDDNNPGRVFLIDRNHLVTLRRIKDKENNGKTLCFEFSEPELDEVVFNRIDGNHRLEALEQYNGPDFLIPFCIVMLSGSGSEGSNEVAKIEMELFHNINSKAVPLTQSEQYNGLFNLFTVAELEQYGKQFSITKEYIEKYNNLNFNNINSFFTDKADMVLSCADFILSKGINITADDLADVFSKLEHTFFYKHEIIRNCKSNKAFVPYVFYMFEGNKQENAKLDAYNTWFIKNKLYNAENFDPASIVDVFNEIYDIRKKQIFVAMPFKKELDFVYTTICEVVTKINRENGIDLLPPIRIDKQIVGFSYDIVEEILENIKNAGLLIADLTEENANVYYEAGFAQGLIKAKLGNTAEVLYLISNPEEPEKAFEAAKFDVNHYKMLPYKNEGNGVEELKKSLEAELKAFYGI